MPSMAEASRRRRRATPPDATAGSASAAPRASTSLDAAAAAVAAGVRPELAHIPLSRGPRSATDDGSRVPFGAVAVRDRGARRSHNARGRQRFAPDKFKTELCRAFTERGFCQYGERCQFAHGEHELRPVVVNVNYKTKLCRTYHLNGKCSYGNRCLFIHEPGDTPPNVLRMTLDEAQRKAPHVPIKARSTLARRRASPPPSTTTSAVTSPQSTSPLASPRSLDANAPDYTPRARRGTNDSSSRDSGITSPPMARSPPTASSMMTPPRESTVPLATSPSASRPLLSPLDFVSPAASPSPSPQLARAFAETMSTAKLAQTVADVVQATQPPPAAPAQATSTAVETPLNNSADEAASYAAAIACADASTKTAPPATSAPTTDWAARLAKEDHDDKLADSSELYDLRHLTLDVLRSLKMSQA